MKKIYILTITILATINISAQCNGRYQTDIYPNVSVTTVQYGSNTDLVPQTVNLMMDIYQPTGDTSTSRPLVILAHAGSFSGGDKGDPDMAYFASELAKKGYVCASINYRLAPSSFSLIVEQTTVKVVFMAVQDGKAAVRFFRQDAATTDTYKINPDQIFFGGTSAGAILGINLSYLDDLSDLLTLPNGANWQTWLNQVGGIEGVSGNPGYCSRTNGAFGFAGGIADTAWIDPDDVPWYGSHALTDATVQYGYGQPLNGFTPVYLYGSGSMNDRTNTTGTYHHLDQYAGGDHPPFINSASIMQNNKDSLATFLYNILDCNPNNLQKPTQKTCSNTVSITDVQHKNLDASIYPNPFNDELTIELTNKAKNTTISIINTLGKVVSKQNATSYINKLSLAKLPAGIYFVEVSTNESSITQKVIKR
ncbi:MAG: hypothetical protein COB15_03165 [Flavobacteriales bacterium]|nr:MAG: hypothetical protein COB15_03165 [Flavobacteriales bacterium]